MPQRTTATTRRLALLASATTQDSTCPAPTDEFHFLSGVVYQEPYTDLLGRFILVAINARGARIQEAVATLETRQDVIDRLGEMLDLAAERPPLELMAETKKRHRAPRA